MQASGQLLENREFFKRIDHKQSIMSHLDTRSRESKSDKNFQPLARIWLKSSCFAGGKFTTHEDLRGLEEILIW
jgi:hypothetical protein